MSPVTHPSLDSLTSKIVLKMAWQTEFWSWMTPSTVETAERPAVGQTAPSTSKLPIPAQDGQPTVLAFLRHCGCPCTCQYSPLKQYSLPFDLIPKPDSRRKDISRSARHCTSVSRHSFHRYTGTYLAISLTDNSSCIPQRSRID